MKHASHGHGGPTKGPATWIGLTMAMLGVMLAFCAAMVGAERTELIKATIDQSNKWGVYQAEATKYRVMSADYEMLHALTPNKAELKKFDEKLLAVRRQGGKADTEDTAELKDALHIATTELADILTPDREDEERILSIGNKYKHDMAEAKEDAEAYELSIETHHHASEWYERAQLCAEIGIVIASIALLLSNRLAWAIAVVIGLAGGSIVGYTVVHTHAQMKTADAKIEEAIKRTTAIEKDDLNEDVRGMPSATPAAEKTPEPNHRGSAPH